MEIVEDPIVNTERNKKQAKYNIEQEETIEEIRTTYAVELSALEEEDRIANELANKIDISGFVPVHFERSELLDLQRPKLFDPSDIATKKDMTRMRKERIVKYRAEAVARQDRPISKSQHKKLKTFISKLIPKIRREVNKRHNKSISLNAESLKTEANIHINCVQLSTALNTILPKYGMRSHLFATPKQTIEIYIPLN